MSDDKNLYTGMCAISFHQTKTYFIENMNAQHSLKHIISFSHTDLINSPSANFLFILFEILKEHTLRTLVTLPFSLISKRVKSSVINAQLENMIRLIIIP
jgi:hypothetical protein